jgi:hypothetical protein
MKHGFLRNHNFGYLMQEADAGGEGQSEESQVQSPDEAPAADPTEQPAAPGDQPADES